ncbi:VRR-NUC domain-containing protein [Spirosoma flavum]|uniref:VRR-NUC domain-containing protein n=1 Tax=Spirosoma flavum TaxID=2048557 RepID=A0ABW6AM05_9BACT
MSNNEMSRDEYLRFIKQKTGPGAPAKIQTRVKSPKKSQPTILSAAQFRAEHVDQDEHDLQSLGIEWFGLAYPQLLMYAIPNAAKRSIILAAKMKAEGLVSGVPDLHLAFPHHGKPGLYIETKTINGSVSDAQAIIHAYLRGVGYTVSVPITFEEFQEAVIDYLKP